MDSFSQRRFCLPFNNSLLKQKHILCIVVLTIIQVRDLKYNIFVTGDLPSMGEAGSLGFGWTSQDGTNFGNRFGDGFDLRQQDTFNMFQNTEPGAPEVLPQGFNLQNRPTQVGPFTNQNIPGTGGPFIDPTTLGRPAAENNPLGAPVPMVFDQQFMSRGSLIGRGAPHGVFPNPVSPAGPRDNIPPMNSVSVMAPTGFPNPSTPFPEQIAAFQNMDSERMQGMPTIVSPDISPFQSPNFPGFRGFPNTVPVFPGVPSPEGQSWGATGIPQGRGAPLTRGMVGVPVPMTPIVGGFPPRHIHSVFGSPPTPSFPNPKVNPSHLTAHAHTKFAFGPPPISSFPNPSFGPMKPKGNPSDFAAPSHLASTHEIKINIQHTNKYPREKKISKKVAKKKIMADTSKDVPRRSSPIRRLVGALLLKGMFG